MMRRVGVLALLLLADEAGTVVGAAHAGWRGLCAGVIESTVAGMRVPGGALITWLGSYNFV